MLINMTNKKKYIKRLLPIKGFILQYLLIDAKFNNSNVDKIIIEFINSFFHIYPNVKKLKNPE